MGLINIACPQCKQVHSWFSGNLDQRCYQCKWTAANAPLPQPPQNQLDYSRYNGEPLPGTIKDESSVWDGQRWHQIVPRRAVEGDIGDWNECQAYKFAHGAEWSNRCRVRVPAQYALRPMTFGEWANNIRTQKLSELNKRAGERMREAEERVANLQDRFNAQYDRIKDLERDYADASKRADEYSAGYAQQRELVEELRATIKTNEDFIALLGSRLRVRMNQLWRVMTAAGLYTGDLEKEARLDP